jgi:predicted DNA-binding transcriptional regulator YafY
MKELKRNLRLLEILTVLRSPRYRTVDELARRFRVSERTIFRDLADLALPYPVESNPAGSGYRLPPDAPLPAMQLTSEEALLLRAMLNSPLVTRQGSAVARLARSLRRKLGRSLAAFEETPAALRLAGVDRSGPRAETALAALTEAIRRGRAVEIVYESLSGRDQRPQRRGLEPWEVFHRGDAWYVVGYCRVHREPRIFRLDRISAVGMLEERAAPPPDFDLETFLAGAWEVFSGRRRHEVVLEFAPALAPLVRNARHHEGEEMRLLPGGALEYRVTLSALDEVARWVVGFGGAVRVVGPEELRRHVVELARQLLDVHGEAARPSGRSRRRKAERAAAGSRRSRRAG